MWWAPISFETPLEFPPLKPTSWTSPESNPRWKRTRISWRSFCSSTSIKRPRKRAPRWGNGPTLKTSIWPPKTQTCCSKKYSRATIPHNNSRHPARLNPLVWFETKIRESRGRVRRENARNLWPRTLKHSPVNSHLKWLFAKKARAMFKMKWENSSWNPRNSCWKSWTP